MTSKGTTVPGSLSEKAINFCSSSEGKTLKEIAEHIDRTPHVTHSMLHPALKSGRMIKAGIKPWSRYFAIREHAEAFEKIAPELVKAHREAMRLKEAERAREYDRARQAQKTADRRAKAAQRPPKEKPPAKPKRASTAMKSSGLTLGNSDAKKLHMQATITYPDGYKKTVAPTPKDDRFSFTPPPGWKGQITQDWMDRHGAA